MKKIKLLHIIPGLGIGGTENMLMRIIAGTSKKIDHYILILHRNEPEKVFKPKINNKKIFIVDLHFSINLFYNLFLLSKIIKKINPNIVQTWQPSADLIGGFIS